MKNILITGVSRGLGLEICNVLLTLGYTVYGISRSVTPEIEVLLNSYPTTFKYKTFDLSDTDNLTKNIKLLIPNDISIHGYVNNAAAAYDDIITNIKLIELKNMFELNVYSPMILTKYAIRNMLLHKTGGSIVHISSISVHTGYKGLSMYAATKGALEAFSKNTSREWGVRGIRSNCVVSGFMETEMSSTLDGDLKEKIKNRTSLKSLTDLTSVANTVEFLISDKSSSITGQLLHVDSGTI
jgi:3-oxoacyl-[acyl-carrier protein] reductase